MKKKLTGTTPYQRGLFQKMWLVMRLTVFLIFLFVFQVAGSVYSQQA
jgi:hypothetical protein